MMMKTDRYAQCHVLNCVSGRGHLGCQILWELDCGVIVYLQEVASKLAALDEPDAPPRKVRACSLDKPTQDLVKLIFDNDMFREAMQSMEIGR